MNKYCLRKANLTDMPFVFYEIYESSIDGVYSDRFLMRLGVIKILVFIMPFFLPFRNSSTRDAFIYGDESKSIGYLLVTSQQNKNTLTKIITIEMMGIKNPYRGVGFGKQMIGDFLETLLPNSEVHAYCTKYARAMQHILVKLKFLRDKKQLLSLQHFHKIIVKQTLE